MVTESGVPARGRQSWTYVAAAVLYAVAVILQPPVLGR